MERSPGCPCRCPDCGRSYTDFDDEVYSLDLGKGHPPPYEPLKEYRAQPRKGRGNTRGGLVASYGKLLEPIVPKGSAAKGRLQKGQRFRAQSNSDNGSLKGKGNTEELAEDPPIVPRIARQSGSRPSTDQFQPPATATSLTTDSIPKAADAKYQSTTSFFCGPPSTTKKEVNTTPPAHGRTKSKVKTRPGPPNLQSPTSAIRSEIVDSPSPSPSVIVPLTSPNHRDLFLRMFGALFTARVTTPFTDFVAAMVDAGFSAQHNAGGSAVTFKDHENRYGGGSIHFHRPHPDARIDYPKLRTWGRRLGMKFGWGEGKFCCRGRVREGKSREVMRWVW